MMDPQRIHAAYLKSMGGHASTANDGSNDTLKVRVYGGPSRGERVGGGFGGGREKPVIVVSSAAIQSQSQNQSQGLKSMSKTPPPPPMGPNPMPHPILKKVGKV
jgi:hypothetical protein